MKKLHATLLFGALIGFPLLAWQTWLSEKPEREIISPQTTTPEAVAEEKPAQPSKPHPQIAVILRPGAVVLTVNFSSYCSPKPKLTYRVEDRSIYVTSYVNPDVPVSRCVEGYRSAINVDGLEAGAYTVVWEGSGTLAPISIEIP